MSTVEVSTTTERSPVARVNTRPLIRAGWIIGALAILAGFAWLTVICSPFVIDDAFISFRYAENLARGHGLVYNPGDYVEGYTNFLWVVIIAAVNALGGDSLLWSKLLGAAANLATLVMVGVAARRWWPRPTLPGLWLLPPLLLATNFGFVLWGIGGLETPLFNCLVTAGLISLVRTVERNDDAAPRLEPEASRPFKLLRSAFRLLPSEVWALFFALAVLARPDAVVLFVGGGLGSLLWLLAHKRLTRALFVRLLIGVALFVSVLLAHTLFRLVYYGDWVPNTYYIKAPSDTAFDVHFPYLLDWLRAWGVLDPGQLASISPGLADVPAGWKYAIGLALSPALSLALLGAWGERRRAWAWVLGISVLAWLLYLSRIYNDWMPGWRYYLPILPATVLFISAGLNQLASAAMRIDGNALRRVAQAAVVFIAAGLVVFSLGEFRNQVWRVGATAEIQQIYREVGESLRAHAPPGTTLALMDAGAIPYYSGLYTIDYAGLTDKHMARVPYRPATVDKGDGVVRHYDQMRYDPDYIFGRQPDLIQLNGTVLPDGRMIIHYPEYGQLYQKMKVTGTYDLAHPVFNDKGEIIVKRKGAPWNP